MTIPNPKMSSLFTLEYPQSVGVYQTYDEAQKAVDHLADANFPVQNLCIVGTDLKSVERVLGKRSWGTVLGSGAQSGISTGLMVTLVMWLFLPGAEFYVLLLTALAIGILIGVAMAALGYWMSQGKRDFTSVSQTVATRYEILSEHKVAAQARDLLAQMPGARASQFDSRPTPTSPMGQPSASPMGQPSASPMGQPSASPMGQPPVSPYPYSYPSAPTGGYPQNPQNPQNPTAYPPPPGYGPPAPAYPPPVSGGPVTPGQPEADESGFARPVEPGEDRPAR